jgi:oligo-alginate lyase
MWISLSLFAALVASVSVGQGAQYLLISQQEIEGAKRKAEEQRWAQQALDSLLDSASQAVARDVEIPDRGGQWPHWYSCKRDGAKLETESRTRHRCPACGAIYTGDPYDAVVLYGVHQRNSRDAQNLGLAYRFTGDPKYATRAAELLLGYAERYRTYELHDADGKPNVRGGRVMAQTLDESVWLIPMAWGYALVRDTLSPEQRSLIETGLFLPAAETIRAHKLGIHNIQCWKNSAVGLAGLVTGTKELVEEAIHDPERGFRVQMAKGVTAEGLWWEGSLGYHHYTMQGVWPLVEAASRAGLDLYSEPAYRRLYEAPLAMALPNGDSPGFNDNAGGNIRGYAPLYELAYARWNQPEFGAVVAHTDRRSVQALLYGAAEVPKGRLVPERSAFLPDAGFAMLRGGGIGAALRFGMHGGGHGHPDKLNLVTFGAGSHLGLDPGSINYGVPLHLEWYKSTVGHNTVAVDQANQSNEPGELLGWGEENGWGWVHAAALKAYPGVALSRRVELSKGKLTDRFECQAAAARVFDWAFHVDGRVSSSLKLAAKEGPLGEANGYQHIRNVRWATTGGGWWIRWETKEGAALTLRMKGAAGTEVFVGEGPGRIPERMIPVVVVRRRGTETVFEAVHEISGKR